MLARALLVLSLVAVCVSNVSAIGSIMTIATRNHDFVVEDWQREVANVLDSEIQDIVVLAHVQSDGTDVYYYIVDPDPDAVALSDIARLSGNEKSVLLYQWWLHRDPRILDFPYVIRNMQLFTAHKTTTNTEDTTTVVEQLFAPSSSAPSVIVQGGAHIHSSAFSLTNDAGNSKTTLQISVTVNAGAQCAAGWLVLCACALVLLLRH